MLLNIFFNLFNFYLMSKEKHFCNYCNISNEKKSLLKCSGCNIYYYCSIDCQRKDWIKHKIICKSKNKNNNKNNKYKKKIPSKEDFPQSLNEGFIYGSSLDGVIFD